MDHEQVTRELVRSLRGRRSQPWLSRRIGLRSNLVYRWESGRAWPSAQQLFRISRVTGVSVAKRLDLLLGKSANVESIDLDQREGVSVLLRILMGPRSINEVAELMSTSRYIVSRWLSGRTNIRVPNLLRFVEVTTLRLLDFVATLVDPSVLPSLASDWARLETARSAAYDAPWSHAVLRVLEVVEHVAGAKPTETWLAQRLNLPLEEVRRSLELLVRSGQVRVSSGRLHLIQQEVIDTGADRERRQQLATFWARVASDRLGAGARGIHAFNLFTIADQDVARVKALHRDFFSALRSLVKESTPPERVVLYAGQLLALDEPQS